ncbi:MAG: histidine kinase [Caldilineaceae bacterium]|nr:histidine kinase [Caldilineaceae bacterium]
MRRAAGGPFMPAGVPVLCQAGEVRAIVKRFYHTLLDRKWFYRDRNFILRLAGQALIFAAVLHFFLQRGRLPGPMLLAGVFLFSVHFWHRTGAYTVVRLHLYMAIQTVVAGLMAFQDFVFAYLFLVLVGQAVLMFRLRSALIWAVVLYLSVLAVNWLHPGDGPLMPEVRALLVTAGMVVAGVLGGSMAQARRAQDKVQSLFAELRDAHDQLQGFSEQSRRLAVAHERDRLARRLRDSLGQRLTASIVQLEGASLLMEADPQRAAGMVEKARAQLGTGLDDLRSTFQGLGRSDHFDAATAEAAESDPGMESEES